MYLIAEAVSEEAPVAPLFAAMATEIHWVAAQLGQASAAGRLDPPLLMGLDEVTQICPVPLPFWLSDSGGKGIQVVAVVHGEAQLAGRWGDYGRQVVLDTSSVKVFLPGITDPTTLQTASTLCGQASWKLRGQDHATRHDVATPDMIRQLPAGFALVIRGGCAPVIARLPRAWNNPAYRRARRLGQAPWHAIAELPEPECPSPASPTTCPPSGFPATAPLLPLELTMTGTDPITAIVDQLAAHAEQLTRLDTREADHHAAVSGQLAELTGQAATIGQAVQEHAAALAQLTAPSPADRGRRRLPPRPGTGLVEADRRRAAGTAHPAAGLGRAGLPARLRAPGRRPRPLLARPRPVPVRARHLVRAVVGAVPAARPQPRPALRPGRIPGPHPARPGRPAPHRDQPLRPPPQPRTRRRPALEQAMTNHDAPPGPGLRIAAAGPCSPACPAEDPAHPARLPRRHHRPAADHRLVRPPPGLEPGHRHRRPRTRRPGCRPARPGRQRVRRLRQLRQAGLLDGAGAYVRTPSGGLHAYFRGSDQRNGHLPAHHLDFRSRGGYVLAPPSQVDGKPYQLIRPRRPTAAWTGPPSPHLLNPSAQSRPAQPHPDPRPGPQPPGPVGRPPGRRQPQRGPVLGRQPRPGRRPGRRPQPSGRRRPPAGLGEREITRTLDSAAERGRTRPHAPDYQAEAGDPS